MQLSTTPTLAERSRIFSQFYKTVTSAPTTFESGVRSLESIIGKRTADWFIQARKAVDNSTAGRVFKHRQMILFGESNPKTYQEGDSDNELEDGDLTFEVQCRSMEEGRVGST
jgi:hypothetical protein